jgi:hypothetical protein
METHFEFLKNDFKINLFGNKLFRIKATKKTKHTEIGDLGGYVEKLENLSGDAWVYGNAEVYGDAEVSGNADLFWISKIGSSYRTTTIFNSKENIVKVRCGCFFGTLLEFENKVKENHKDNKHSKEYLALIEIAKAKFNF